ncbi:MAG: 50S ribosomal protein L13 [Candidatus Omnitrophica bacterium]|nr:50S ribosomal protein L13 [Candidatus Omnitrophota bacterium]
MAVQKTTVPNAEQVVRKFYIVDADGKVLGRVAAKVAGILRGKNKPTFTPNMDTGDNVIIINAEKIRVTGKKMSDKFYDRYSGFHSGLKSIRYSDMLAQRPHKILELAIHRMIPHGKLGARLKNKLYVYAGSTHPHAAQKPVALDI